MEEISSLLFNIDDEIFHLDEIDLNEIEEVMKVTEELNNKEDF